MGLSSTPQNYGTPTVLLNVDDNSTYDNTFAYINLAYMSIYLSVCVSFFVCLSNWFHLSIFHFLVFIVCTFFHTLSLSISFCLPSPSPSLLYTHYVFYPSDPHRPFLHSRLRSLMAQSTQRCVTIMQQLYDHPVQLFTSTIPLFVKNIFLCDIHFEWFWL